jgi:hypothetical protein
MRVTPTVSVVIPWRGGCPHRTAALELILDWWHQTHPAWQTVVADCDDGPWRKAVAIIRGALRVDADVIVVADADVIVYGASAGVANILGGSAWISPFSSVIRFSQVGTRTLVDEHTIPDLERIHQVDKQTK